MTEDHTSRVTKTSSWMRLPNGTRVRLREGGQEGVIDGLTELVVGAGRNPDGKTQYRINVGERDRMLVTETALLVLTDADGLVLILKENPDFRRYVTDRLRGTLPADSFVTAR